MIIAIDFDGTCVESAFPAVGPSIGAEPVLKELVSAGHKLILWTVRSDGRKLRGKPFEPLREAVTWFRDAGIRLHGVNCNPGQIRWSQSPKMHADLYIDDKALGIPLTAAGYVDWAAVRDMLVSRGVLQGEEVGV